MAPPPDPTLAALERIAAALEALAASVAAAGQAPDVALRNAAATATAVRPHPPQLAVAPHRLRDGRLS